MKSWLKALLVTMVISYSASATIVIDATTKNGSFDENKEPKTVFGTGSRFNVTPSWTNIKTDDNLAPDAANNAAAYHTVATDFSAILTDTDQSTSNRRHSNKTDYVIQADDYFTVSMDWFDTTTWQNADTIEVVLFATANNAAGGSVLWSETIDMGIAATAANSDEDWDSTGTLQSGVVDGAAVGQVLFFQMYGVNGAAREGDFVRVDNVVVQAIPEPATLILFGGAGLAGLMIRRRKLRG